MESVVAFVIGVLIMLVGVAISIGLHEIGHLVPAKLFKVRVVQYMIGFGPTLWSRKAGETEYGIKAIPLGGYISMIGMFPPGKSGETKAQSTGFFRALVQDARDQSAESIGADDEGRAFYQLPAWKRIIIMFGGPFMNLLLAFVFFGILFMGFGFSTPSTSIGSVSSCVLPADSTRQSCSPDDPIAPGAAAGLKAGDRIVSINGQKITAWTQATQIIREHANQPLAFVVNRNGVDKSIPVTPMTSVVSALDAKGQPITDSNGKLKTVDAGFVGILSAYERVVQPPSAVVNAVGQQIGSVAGVILNLPQRVIDVANAAFGSAPRDPNGPVSLVGVGRAAGEAASVTSAPIIDRAAWFIGIVGSLNVALFVFNMVPLLPLDGGHIIGAIWESIRRGFNKLFKRPDPGPVDLAKLMPLTLTVVVIMGGLSLLLMYADIVKPIQLL